MNNLYKYITLNKIKFTPILPGYEINKYQRSIEIKNTLNGFTYYVAILDNIELTNEDINTIINFNSLIDIHNNKTKSKN